MLIQANDHRAILWRILVLYVLCGMHAQHRAACCASAECQLGAPQHPLVRSCKADTLQVLQVLIKVLTKDKDIIKVYSHTLVQQVLEHQIHQALEGGRSIGKA